MAKVLILNSKSEICGVHQYGLCLQSILKKSSKHKYEISSDVDEIKNHDIIIFNYHEKLFDWLNDEYIKNINKPCLAIGGHDCTPNFKNIKFILNCDSTSELTDKNIPLPRPVKKFVPYENPQRVTIGSIGFSYSSKNFDKIYSIVSQHYDDALIRIHAPQHPQGESLEYIIEKIRLNYNSIYSKNIGIEISCDFLSDDDLIKFLSSNTANIFLLPKMSGRGLSSSIDKALSARKPIAISDSEMYRHINIEDKFLLSKNTLPQIISYGTDHLKPFLEMYSEENMIEIFDKTINLTHELAM
jgi:hypothetical protein